MDRKNDKPTEITIFYHKDDKEAFTVTYSDPVSREQRHVDRMVSYVLKNHNM